ncbi:hypothetical protein FOA52_005495 [Chlamydomonas sp. UWO 241]|nr:hypothetical protein FOA52_005495 [Chlamydomonas sp. UWO 241]
MLASQRMNTVGRSQPAAARAMASSRLGGRVSRRASLQVVAAEKGKQLMMWEALREATDEEMERDPCVCVMGEDVGHYGGSYKVTYGLHKKYGDMRVLDTPICENGFMGMGIGAAMTGLRPIIEGMNMGFLLLAFNQISNNCGMLHYTSGGQYKAIRSDNPIIFFEHVLLYNIKGEAGGPDEVQCLEKAEMVREGTDVSIFTYSRMRYVVMQAVAELEKKGYNPEVIDLISLKPFDIHTISQSIKKTKKCIIVEECMKTGGIGASLSAVINESLFDDLDHQPPEQ